MNLLKTIVLDHYGALITAIFTIWYSKSYFWTHMDYYRLKWTKMDPFHIYLFKTIILDHYGPILLGSGQNLSFRPIWTQFVWIYPKSHFWTHLDHYGPILCKFTKNHSPGPNWTYMDPFQHIWIHSVPLLFRPIQTHLD